MEGQQGGWPRLDNFDVTKQRCWSRLDGFKSVSGHIWTVQLIASAKEAPRGGMLDNSLGMCYLRLCVAVSAQTSEMCQS